MLSQGEQMLKNLQSFPSQLVGKKRGKRRKQTVLKKYLTYLQVLVKYYYKYTRIYTRIVSISLAMWNNLTPLLLHCLNEILFCWWPVPCVSIVMACCNLFLFTVFYGNVFERTERLLQLRRCSR